MPTIFFGRYFIFLLYLASWGLYCIFDLTSQLLKLFSQGMLIRYLTLIHIIWPLRYSLKSKIKPWRSRYSCILYACIILLPELSKKFCWCHFSVVLVVFLFVLAEYLTEKLNLGKVDFGSWFWGCSLASLGKYMSLDVLVAVGFYGISCSHLSRWNLRLIKTKKTITPSRAVLIQPCFLPQRFHSLQIYHHGL